MLMVVVTDIETARWVLYSENQIAAGSYHTCVVLDDDTVKCWGYNDITDNLVMVIQIIEENPGKYSPNEVMKLFANALSLT